MKKIFGLMATAVATLALTACFGSQGAAMADGGEVTGVRGSGYGEPTPYGMVAVRKGSLKVGLEENDTLWGVDFPRRDISVDGFWIDAQEIGRAHV